MTQRKDLFGFKEANKILQYDPDDLDKDLDEDEVDGNNKIDNKVHEEVKDAKIEDYDMAAESKKVTEFARANYVDRESDYGYSTAKHIMTVATQLWYKELNSRIKDKNGNAAILVAPAVEDYDGSEYGMPHLVLVKMAAFLFRVIHPKYDKNGTIRRNLIVLLNQSPAYKKEVSDIIWVIDQMQFVYKDRDVRDDLLGYALNIASDAEYTTYFGFKAYERRMRITYSKLNIDPDTDMDTSEQDKVMTEVKSYIINKLFQIKLDEVFRTKSGLVMALDLQKKLAEYLVQMKKWSMTPTPS